MTLYNENGTQFKVSGKYQIYDPNPCNKKNELFTRWDEEIIKIGGIPLHYYEVLIQFNTLDKLYLEDRGKIFSPCPITLWAYYEPPNQNAASTLYGADSPDLEVIFESNYNACRRDIGHEPKIGSRLYSPHLCENWILIDRRSSEYKGWGVLRLEMHCRKFQETRTNSDAQVTKHDDPGISPIV